MAPDFERELESLKKTIQSNRPGTDTSIVEEAFWLSKEWHGTQKRLSGEPYFVHPLAVAKMLAEKGMDEVIVSAALLHDIVEDTSVGRGEIKRVFGSEIYGLVDSLTKLDIVATKSRQEMSTANIIKTIMAASKDIRVLLIKLHDKFHNLHTIHYLPVEKQKTIAADALTVYVPLAHKLGMHAMKYELEDICFRALEPKKFAEMSKQIERARTEKAKEIRQAAATLMKKYQKTAWSFSEKRKSFYSVYSKMIAKNMQLAEINDTLILKILVPDKPGCYDALGKVHCTFKPIPGKMKDFIAIPEYAIYQSLHTQVIGPSKKPLKVYIFSAEMNEIADNGVLALLREKEKHEWLFREYSKMFAKIRSPHINDNVELAGTLNLDFHNRAMIVFNEKGDTINLPVGSTALDMAFFQDEKSAKHASKAQVNGKIVPLWTKLNSGDRVRIHYALTAQLSTNWQTFVNSDRAKKLIDKEISKNNLVEKKMRLVKFEMEAIDRPGLLAAQSEIISKSGLDMEAIKAVCTIDKTTCRTEIYIRNSSMENIQKALKGLRDMQETLDLKVDYFK